MPACSASAAYGSNSWRHIQATAAQRLQIAFHCLVRHASNLVGIETMLPQIMLEAQPGRRDPRNGSQPQRRQIGQAKPGTPAHEKKRITRHNLTEAGEG